MRFRAVQRILGALIGLSSLFSLPALALALLFREDTAQAFLDSFLAAGVLGFVMWWPVRRVRYELRLRDGFFITTGAWVLASLVAALPFMLAPPHLSYVDAVFEAVSGLTTTGATTIVGLDHLPRSVLFYRQSLNFYGGMGIVVLAVAIMPMLKIGGMQLFRAEAGGPTKDNKLTPRIAESAKALWMIYVGLNVVCALVYWAGGMSPFDAVCHAMSTVATAGFSTHDASFGFWNSAMIDTIAIVFMLIGGVNFGLHYVAWRRATMAPYQSDTELKSYVLILFGVTVAITLVVWLGNHFDGLATSFRHAAFQTVSNMTTTGFTNTGFPDWPAFAPLLLIMVAFIGGSSGSTSGGMKVARVVMALRQGVREVRQLVHPKGQFLVKMGGRRVSESIVLSVGGFCTLYIMCFLAVMLVLAGTGLDLVTAFAAAATCINNLGPGLGTVAVHFADMPDVAVWVCSLAMILGRLEVFTVLVLLTPAFWRE